MISNVPGSLCGLRVGKDHSKKVLFYQLILLRVEMHHKWKLRVP
jgi:hypothetical protein